MSPCACRDGVSASQTSKDRGDFLSTPISSLARGKASRSSSGPTCACAGPSARNSSPPSRVMQARRTESVRLKDMAVIVSEFDAACKIEARQEHALAAREAGGRPEAEAPRYHAVDGPRAAELSTRCWLSVSTVHLSSPSVANTRCSPSNSRVTLVRSARPGGAFRHVRDAEHEADAPTIATHGTADAHAYAAPGRPWSARAFHLDILPVEIQFDRTTQARAQIAVTGDEAAAVRRRIR